MEIHERRKPNWEYLRTQSVAVSFSGGMDSTAVLLLAVQNGLHPTAVWTDGDTEHPESQQYRIEICNQLLVPFIKYKVKNSYQYFVKCIKTCPDYLSAFSRFYRRQYHIPLRKILKSNDFTVRLVGYRADENQWNMGKSTFAPIFPWSKQRVRALLEENNIPLHPCYDQSDFLEGTLQESSWIDVEGYGLFNLTNTNEIHRDAEITLKWLKRYYPEKYDLVLQSLNLSVCL